MPAARGLRWPSSLCLPAGNHSYLKNNNNNNNGKKNRLPSPSLVGRWWTSWLGHTGGKVPLLTDPSQPPLSSAPTLSGLDRGAADPAGKRSLHVLRILQELPGLFLLCVGVGVGWIEGRGGGLNFPMCPRRGASVTGRTYDYMKTRVLGPRVSNLGWEPSSP